MRAMLNTGCLLAVFFSAGCHQNSLPVTDGPRASSVTRNVDNGDASASAKSTALPFDVDNFTDEQRAVIRAANDSDRSSYLIQSRPVVFQIVWTGNDAAEVRKTGPIEQTVDVLIYALGEEEENRLVDYGWIEHVDSGKKVWEMKLENSAYAGGDPRNRKSLKRMTLRPGTYRLHYVSNSSHACPDWQGEPPERSNFYGVTVFNMTALPLLEEKMRSAGVPSLKSSLQSGKK